MFLLHFFCLSSHLLIDVCIASTLCLLWILLICKLVYKYIKDLAFSYFVYIPKCGIARLWFSVFKLLKSCKLAFRVAAPPVMHGQDSNFTVSLARIAIFSFKYIYRHTTLPNRFDMVSYYDFDLHLPNDSWYWTSFHELTGHLCIFFGDTYSPFSVFELANELFCYCC